MTLNDRLGTIYRSTDEGGGGYETDAPDSLDYQEPQGSDFGDDGYVPDEARPPEWFHSFAHEVAGKIGELEQRFQPSDDSDHYDPWQQDDAYRSLDARMAQHTSTGMRMMGEMMRPVVESQVVQHVAGDLEPEAQEYIRSELRGMDPVSMVNLTRNPHAMRMLKFAAQGYTRQGPQTDAPRSEGIYSPSSNLDAGAEKEIAAYLRAFGRYGATRQMAVAAYRRATGGGR